MLQRIMTALVLSVWLVTGVLAQDGLKVDKLLKEIDPWVTKDTTRILAFIDSTNAVSTQMLESSPDWEPTMRDLSFLMGIDYIGEAQIDNTGRIYFTMRITGESEALFYMDSPMSWPIQLTPNNWTEEGFTISYFQVHPSGDYILVGVSRYGDEMHDIWYFGRDGQFRPLLVNREVRYSGVTFNDDDPDQFFLYTDDQKVIHLARYTLSTGKLDTLYTEAGAFYPVDYRQGKLIVLREFSFSDGQMALFDLATGKITDLTDTALFWAAAFTAEGKIITLTSAKSQPDEFMKFCLLDPAKPKQLTVCFDPRMETDEFTFVEPKGISIAALNKDGYSQLMAFDLSGKVQPVPAAEIGVISGISNNDLGDVTYAFSSPTLAPTAYKFRLGATSPDRIATVSTFGFDFSKVNVEVVRYKSEGSIEIPALVYRPATAKQDGTNPAIVNYHGGPPGQSRPYFQRNIAFALAKGFIVVFPNVRGSTGYGPAYEQADNLEKRFGSLVDCEKALDYLIDNHWSTPDRIAIWGGSYGGYVVDWLSTHASSKYACAVSQVGVSDVDHTNVTSSQVFRKGWEKEMGPVGSKLTRQLSPVFYAEDLSKPILLTAGFNDPRVPPSDPRRFAYVLSKLGKPVWYYEETKAGHGGSFKSQVIFDYTCAYVFTLMNIAR